MYVLTVLPTRGGNSAAKLLTRDEARRIADHTGLGPARRLRWPWLRDRASKEARQKPRWR
jgi:hypothetical protein